MTASIILGRYRTPLLDENKGTFPLAVKVIPNRRNLTSRGRDRLTLLQRSINLNLRALSTSDPAIFDTASIEVKTRREVRRFSPKPAPLPLKPRGTGR